MTGIDWQEIVVCGVVASCGMFLLWFLWRGK